MTRKAWQSHSGRGMLLGPLAALWTMKQTEKSITVGTEL